MTAILLALAALFMVCALVAAAWAAVGRTRRLLEDRLALTDAELRRLGDATMRRDDGAADVRHEISSFRAVLDQLRVREEERRSREDQSWAALHRVTSVLAGGQRAGRAGENVLRESLAHFPPSMVVTDLRVNGRVVEFGLVLPDGRRLPVDSKWSAERELEALGDCADPTERERLVRVVERTVQDRAREVANYLDPSLTAPVGVAAIPDAAYAVLRRAHAEAYRRGVIVIPYSMAVPVLLFLYSLVSRFGAAGDVDGCLADLSAALQSMEATVENRMAKAVTMLSNGADDLRGQIGKARTTLARARESSADRARLDVAEGARLPLDDPGAVAPQGVVFDDEEGGRLVGLLP